MAFTAVGTVGGMDLGKFLKIYSTNGIYNNLAEQSEMWKFFLKLKKSVSGGREVRYLVRKTYGPAAFEMLDAGSGGNYPAKQRSEIAEATANYKEFALTVNVPRNLINKTGSDLLAYADPLVEEMEAKAIVAARLLSGNMYRDGSGRIGELASTPTDFTSGYAVCTLSTATATGGYSHIGWFEEGDKIAFVLPTAVTAQTFTLSGGSLSYYKVESVDEDNNKFTVGAYNSSDTRLVITAANTVTSGDFVHRASITAQDYDETVTDWGSSSAELVGLESFTEDDGRVVHGLTLSGALKGTRVSGSGAQIDSSHFQAALSRAKRNAGKGKYKWENAFMYDSTYDSLIEQSETDRRIQTIDDATRGFKRIGYQHGKDFVEFIPDEFCHKNRVYMPPTSKDVLEFYGTDLELVEPNPGQKFHLAVSSTAGRHSREMQAYMEGYGVIVCKHAAAIPVIENFSASV